MLGTGMLQSHKAQPQIISGATKLEMLSAAETLRAFVSFLRRQSPVIVFVTLLALALGATYVVTARPSFTATAQLLIDARKVQVFQQQSILGDIPVDTAQVESQVEVLKSENVASAVIKKLHLTEDPEFVGSGGGLVGTLVGLINPFASDQISPNVPSSEFELDRRAMQIFLNRLSIKRIGLTYIIQISFQSFDADRAAQVVNAVADAYIGDQLDAKYQATRRASVWLQDRIKELRDQVSESERAVVNFKTKNNIVSTGGTDKPLLGQQQVAELSSQLVIARAHTADARARLDRINSVLKANSPNASFGATVTDTLKSDVVSKLRSQYLELAARESDWSARYGRNHLATVNLRNQMQEIRNAIFDELKRLGETYKSDYEIAKQREVGVQKELAQSISQSQATDLASVSLRELQSTAQTYKSLYDNFLQRYTKSVQQQSFPISKSRLISSASRPLHKSSPKTLLALAIAGLAGMTLGFGIGVLRDLSDRVFRSSEQVESLLQTECIALVPLLMPPDASPEPDAKANADASNLTAGVRWQDNIWATAKSLFPSSAGPIISPESGSSPSETNSAAEFGTAPIASARSDEEETKTSLFPNGKVVSRAAGSRTILLDDIGLKALIDEPFSRFAEAIRSVKLAVDLNGTIKKSRTIGVTSALPNEGKSTISLALAHLMSQAKGRTILVDCDLRNPSLSRMLTPDATSGLLEVVTKNASLEEAIWKDPATDMAFLPVVKRARLANSNEILSSIR